MAQTNLTPEELYTRMLVQTARSGMATNAGPNSVAFQMEAVYNDTQLCLAQNDTVRYNQLLTKATEVWGSLPTTYP